ncbi:hypothetical protein ABI_01150 [Asticcacaulis biprosthecium C19]|uniref:DUF1190 domain-containing protein n=1 Tax=Asticcacaulis biprosthecium C19 TaxID=715226 RepID=F4QHX4_9CAUL|nr:DUF1190 domain-containing protein [Asticcacaulis biprosthecium]EGF91685.1 hypothetical protein ABI_01150 [Asticcacaulis biprosthecium C19]
MTNSTRAYRARFLGEMKHRRARWLAMLACTTSALGMLGGCGNPAPRASGDWDSGGNNDAIVYNSLAECKAAQADDRICDEAQSQAAAAQEGRTYSRKEQCEAEYGAGHCESRNGGGWFVPALTGFMLARAMNNVDLDTYRRRGGNAYAAPVYAGGSRAASRSDPSKPGYKASSRGGFGGSSAVRGGCCG